MSNDAGVVPTESPRHVAVIPDGNRHWAHEHHLPVLEAYRVGAQRVHELTVWCDEASISHVTVWALSTDNLQRGPEAVSEILNSVIDELAEMTVTERWRIRIIGALDLLPGQAMAALRAITDRTQDSRGLTLNVAVAYSGRDDIITAVHVLLHDHRSRGTAGNLDDGLDETTLGRYLSTAGQPDVDLMIRTGGTQRLSGFMPWQAAHAELYFTPIAWPDFTREDFQRALHWFTASTRRFGR